MMESTVFCSLCLPLSPPSLSRSFSSQAHSQFLDMVQNLALTYLPPLSGINLRPYLLRSQAASVYDAVWGLSRAWHTILPPLVYTYNVCSISNSFERRCIAAALLNQALNGTLNMSTTTGYDPSFFLGVAVRKFTGGGGGGGGVLLL